MNRWWWCAVRMPFYALVNYMAVESYGFPGAVVAVLCLLAVDFIGGEQAFQQCEQHFGKWWERWITEDDDERAARDV